MDMDSNFLENALSNLHEDLQHKKHEILRQRLRDFGINIDEEKEKGCRFKSLAIELDPLGVERVYFNDGSDDGLLIITFYPMNISQGTGFSMSAGFNYL